MLNMKIAKSKILKSKKTKIKWTMKWNNKMI